MKITEVEGIILRQSAVDGAIADGSQDDLVVRVTPTKASSASAKSIRRRKW